MARNAHAFVRGSTASFYAWLESGAGKASPEGPLVWICGDAHIGNLGPIARCDQHLPALIEERAKIMAELEHESGPPGALWAHDGGRNV